MGLVERRRPEKNKKFGFSEYLPEFSVKSRVSGTQA